MARLVLGLILDASNVLLIDGIYLLFIQVLNLDKKKSIKLYIKFNFCIYFLFFLFFKILEFFLLCK